MWHPKTKKNKPVSKWHNKAMLVDPRKTKITIVQTEVPEMYETEENLNKVLNMEVKDSNLITSEDSEVADTKERKATNSHEVADYTYRLIAAEEGPLNIKFLRALEKTRSKLNYDGQLAKISRKLKKGKNLKKGEFDKVYMHIRAYCQFQ